MFVQSVSLLATACLCEFARGREEWSKLRTTALRSIYDGQRRSFHCSHSRVRSLWSDGSTFSPRCTALKRARGGTHALYRS